MTVRSVIWDLSRVAFFSTIAGVVIGAADGVAMTLSPHSVSSDRELGISPAHAALMWASGAAELGGITGLLVGVPLSGIFFKGRPSVFEFFCVTLASLIGGVLFCFAFGDSLMELSWLATPGFAVLASLVVWSFTRGAKT
jgi:hypothetical protein